MLKVRTQGLGSISILCLQGRICVDETEALRSAVQSQLDVKTIVLDFAQVIGIDAAGLGMLLELRQWTKENGIEFRLLNLTEHVKQVLEITCLSSVFDISSEADVLFLTPSGQLTEIRTCSAST